MKVHMPEGDVIDLPEPSYEIKMPCGMGVTVNIIDGKRVYYANGKEIWNPELFHRVGLMAIMLHEDSQRYIEKCQRENNVYQCKVIAVPEEIK